MDILTIKEVYMADITMCQSLKCRKRDYCYRHKATPERSQNYFVTDPSDPEDGCEYFWDMRPERKKEDE